MVGTGSLPVDEGIRGAVDESTVRAVQVLIPSSRPRLTAGDQVPKGESLSSDCGSVTAFLKDDEASAALVFVKDVPESNVDWLLISCIHADAAQAAKGLWSTV